MLHLQDHIVEISNLLDNAISFVNFFSETDEHHIILRKSLMNLKRKAMIQLRLIGVEINSLQSKYSSTKNQSAVIYSVAKKDMDKLKQFYTMLEKLQYDLRCLELQYSSYIPMIKDVISRLITSFGIFEIPMMKLELEITDIMWICAKESFIKTKPYIKNLKEE